MDSGLRRNDGVDAFAMQQKVFCKGLGLFGNEYQKSFCFICPTGSNGWRVSGFIVIKNNLLAIAADFFREKTCSGMGILF
ncbi:MAG: hypothetical protein Q4G28_01760 [Neisseria sp.]|nr:hypothetical protein [Neisseria sp.]